MNFFTPNYRPRLPRRPRPICLVGAGGIARDAHLPAYRMAGFPVHSVADVDRDAAEKLAADFGIDSVFDAVEGLVADAPGDAVFDLAVPADRLLEVLKKLPRGAPVLLQKPMGETIGEAREILAVCRERDLLAAVNFQLRFAPFVAAAKDLIDRGLIGELRDVEARVTVETPWDLFPFLRNVRRLEIVYHSVHYIDCIRNFLGDPSGVFAKSIRHPELEMKESRSAIILDYGERVRANIQTNHFHRFGPDHQESYLKWEGTEGAIKAKMGLLMNYPEGVPDRFEVCVRSEGGSVRWTPVSLEGSWFPHAFVGSMAQVMRAADGEEGALVTPVEDAVRTMACVEAAYASSASGGVDPLAYLNPPAGNPS